jgi:phosphoribosylanthranilate isomerase
MPVQVKICGINSREAAEAVLRAGADFAGLVFFAASPRNLSLEEGVSLAGRLRRRLKLAALVVDESDEKLAAIAHRVKPDFFQLHGKETPQRAAEIRKRFGIPLIKALPIRDGDDLALAGDYGDVADLFLFDAPVAQDATRPGGHGAAFGWRMLSGRSFARPWFLAGGLTPENVAGAIAVSGAGLVDVSSGVESAPGLKSESRIADFVAAAKGRVRA